ncbi:hypothetical protein R1flu_005220 [Riccia fluitans]|uniref:Uncharacterized protein n=1 Tax=Riccia fluitans TaxID=41844 RepID=A0ABD1YT26_9MARC
MVHLGNCMGLTYTDKILKANARSRNNKERISGFIEEVKKLSRLIKDALASLVYVKDVLEANEQRITKLTEEKAAVAVLQVKRDTEASQWIAELRVAQETSERTITRQRSKIEELVASLQTMQWELGVA